MPRLSAPATALLVAYILTIFAANLAITALGIVPVGFGLMAPAGVYFAGLALIFAALDAGARVEIYGRHWRIKAPGARRWETIADDAAALARLRAIAAEPRQAGLWDDDAPLAPATAPHRGGEDGSEHED